MTNDYRPTTSKAFNCGHLRTPANIRMSGIYENCATCRRQIEKRSQAKRRARLKAEAPPLAVFDEAAAMTPEATTAAIRWLHGAVVRDDGSVEHITF